MKEMEKQLLVEAGIDIDSALERMMGSEALLQRLFRKFLEDDNYRILTAAVENGDRQMALTASHTLKGMCGNLSCTRLYGLFAAQVDRMRSEDWDGAAGMMTEIREAYEAAAGAVRRCFG